MDGPASSRLAQPRRVGKHFCFCIRPQGDGGGGQCRRDVRGELGTTTAACCRPSPTEALSLQLAVQG